MTALSSFHFQTRGFSSQNPSNDANQVRCLVRPQACEQGSPTSKSAAASLMCRRLMIGTRGC
jgi:hypothetical protein